MANEVGPGWVAAHEPVGDLCARPSCLDGKRGTRHPGDVSRVERALGSAHRLAQAGTRDAARTVHTADLTRRRSDWRLADARCVLVPKAVLDFPSLALDDSRFYA